MAPRPAIPVLLALMTVLSLTAVLPRSVSAGTAVVFYEDFESGTFDPRWAASFDANPASGNDSWGVTAYRPYNGTYSAWSAQVGTQSDTGFNNTDVHQYDNDMQTDLVIDLSVNGFTSLALSLQYWSRAESGGGDYLEAWYVAGNVSTMIFQNRGNAAWDTAAVAVPNDIERLIIRFTSDGGNHGFEGAYVDNILLTGVESTPPSSSVSPLPTFMNTIPTPIPYVAQDGANESGVAHVELWWRFGAIGMFALYAPPSNPLGRWTQSPVPFDPAQASGQGLYEFYTVAVDNAQNPEAVPAIADATTTIDATPPTVTILAPSAGSWTNASDLAVSWSGADSVSGIDRFETSVDGGAATDEGTATARTVAGLADGDHTLAVTAYDRAGNTASVNVTFGVDATTPTVSILAPSGRRSFTVDRVTVRWNGTDAMTGIDHYEVQVDSGAPQRTTDLEIALSGLADGMHTVRVVAVDGAGNAAEAAVTFRVNTNPWSWDGPYGPFPWILVILVIVAFLLLLLYLWKRRESSQAAPTDSKAEEEGEQEAREGTETDAPEEPPEPPEPDEDEL